MQVSEYGEVINWATILDSAKLARMHHMPKGLINASSQVKCERLLNVNYQPSHRTKFEVGRELGIYYSPRRLFPPIEALAREV